MEGEEIKRNITGYGDGYGLGSLHAHLRRCRVRQLDSVGDTVGILPHYDGYYYAIDGVCLDINV